MCTGETDFGARLAGRDPVAERNTAANQAAAVTALNPLAQPLPDVENAVQARLKAKQQIQLLAGYRSTFLTGPRGPGGPTLQAQSDQLNPSNPDPAAAPTDNVIVDTPAWFQTPEDNIFAAAQAKARNRGMPAPSRY